MPFSSPSSSSASSSTLHPLDNVIWQALTTRQTHFAESCGEARRFLREVTLLSALQEPSDRGYDSLAGLVGPGGTAALFLDEPYSSRPGWDLLAGPRLIQMVYVSGNGTNLPPAAPRVDGAPFVELGPRDSPEMVELAALTKPGPFSTRTHELGTYLGIRRNGKLVAMAGERMKVPGHTEVSAVCTHSEHTGQGFAGILMTEVMRRILARGETPFLHSREDNARAVALYERLGFKTRVRGHLALLRRNMPQQKD